MHWLKEVERAKSIDELMTSRSIVGRRDFTDYDMLDAKVASAWKKPGKEQVSKSSEFKQTTESYEGDQLRA